MRAVANRTTVPLVTILDTLERLQSEVNELRRYTTSLERSGVVRKSRRLEAAMEPQLLRVADTARVLGLGRSKTYELISSGDVPIVRIGKSIRVPLGALQRWIERKAAEAETEATARREARP